MSNFQASNTFDMRKDTSNKILDQYPDRIPVIVEPIEGCRIVIDKHKFLAPSEITIGKFMCEIRKHMSLGSNDAIFIFVSKDVLPSSSETMNNIYRRHKDDDGFLYVSYASERAFGLLGADSSYSQYMTSEKPNKQKSQSHCSIL